MSQFPAPEAGLVLERAVLRVVVARETTIAGSSMPLLLLLVPIVPLWMRMSCVLNSIALIDGEYRPQDFLGVFPGSLPCLTLLKSRIKSQGRLFQQPLL
jgi:hypothetical protein